MPKLTSETLSSTLNTIPGWETKQLSEVCEIERGGSPRPIDSFLTDDPSGINWIKIGDTKGITKYIYQTQEKIRPEGARRSRLVVEGDFILSNSMSFGRPYIMKCTGCIHDGWLLLRPKEPRINQDFLYYVLGSNLIFKEFDRLAAGSTVRNLNIGLVKSVRIPVPPRREQERIVTMLDEAFEGIASAMSNAEQNLLSSRALFDSRLSFIFSEQGASWERVTLAELLERGWIEDHMDGNHGGDYPRKEEFILEGTPYISANCLNEDEVDLSKAKYLAPERAAKLRKGFAKNGDVLFAHNATVGPVAILRTSEPSAILGTSLTYYRCNPKQIKAEYLAQYMRSHSFRAQYKASMGQMTRNQVPITKQREFYHVVPPLSEQIHIANELDHLSAEAGRLERVYEQKINALVSLKQSLLHQAFSGNL